MSEKEDCQIKKKDFIKVRLTKDLLYIKKLLPTYNISLMNDIIFLYIINFIFTRT